MMGRGGSERRRGDGIYLLFVHLDSGADVWVSVHPHDAGRLGKRILWDA